jgi:hypothetical protein
VVTIPLIHRFLVNKFGVIQSVFFMRLPYRTYSKAPPNELAPPSAKATKARRCTGMDSSRCRVRSNPSSTSRAKSPGDGDTEEGFLRSFGVLLLESLDRNLGNMLIEVQLKAMRCVTPHHNL